jgi:hypothetical protein
MIQMTAKEYAMKRLTEDLRNDDYSTGEESDEYLLTGRGWNIYRKEDGTFYIHIDDEFVSSEDFDLEPEIAKWVEELL